jgi:hypothetical protein
VPLEPQHALHTKVRKERSKGHIEAAVGRYDGCIWHGIVEENGRAIINFQRGRTYVRIVAPIPAGEQEERSMWRSMLAGVQGNLEMVARRALTFEQAFYAHIVLSDGTTMFERTKHLLIEHRVDSDDDDDNDDGDDLPPLQLGPPSS